LHPDDRPAFRPDGVSSAWAVSVGYLDSAPRPAPDRAGGRIDYRAILSSEEFELFGQLRSPRETLA
jgi:hypothetical protein